MTTGVSASPPHPSTHTVPTNPCVVWGKNRRRSPWLVCGPESPLETGLSLEVPRGRTALAPGKELGVGAVHRAARVTRSQQLRTPGSLPTLDCGARRERRRLSVLWSARLGSRLFWSPAPHTPTLAGEGGVRLLALLCRLEKGKFYLCGFDQKSLKWPVPRLPVCVWVCVAGHLWERVDVWPTRVIVVCARVPPGGGVLDPLPSQRDPRQPALGNPPAAPR